MRPRVHKEKGFTVWELIIVLIVVGALAAISIPSYQNFIAIDKNESNVYTGNGGGEKDLPSTSVDLVDRIMSNLDWGNIAYSPPSNMDFQQSKVIELLLSPSKSIEELQKELERNKKTEGDRIKISNQMEAQLSGRNFLIEALTPDVQAVGRERTTRWAWEVTPTDHGVQPIHLTISAHIAVNGTDRPLVLRTYDRHVEVEITTSQHILGFLEKNWQWLWAAILVPVATFFWRRLRKAHKE